MLAVLLCSGVAVEAQAAGAYRYDDGDQGREVVGFSRGYTVARGETLYEIARRSGLGIKELADANAGVDKLVPGAGRRLRLPTSWVLPMSMPDGIVINLAEMRLYSFGSGGLVSSYPIGIGVEGFETPEGSFVIGDKLIRPTWYPPESIRQEDPALPFAVGQGDENPLGEYAIRLSDTNYFIHGTNKPLGVGMRISHGCIRLYPEDIAALFRMVRPGTRVEIVYQPVKIGMKGREIYVEVHEDYLARHADLAEHALDVARGLGVAGMIDMGMLTEALANKSGEPRIVGRAHEDFFYAGAKSKPPLEEEAPRGSP